LVAAQAAIATLLLIGAGLLWTSFREVMHVDPGFSPERILTARIVLSRGTRYDEDDTRRAFYRQLTDRVAALPEVVEAGMVNSLPLSEILFPRPFSIENRDTLQVATEDTPPRANYISVSTNYFHLMGIRILAGRSFGPLDEEGAPVVLINEAMARRYFPQGDAVGQCLKLGPGNWRPWMTIVGITADVRDSGRDAPVEPTFYVPYQQKVFVNYTIGGMFLVAKTRLDPDIVVSRIRGELSALDPEPALANIDTMAGRMNEAVAGRRYHSSLMGLFALLALTLAMIGVFGVLSCVVGERRREIGVRMALGSQRSDLFLLILKQGLRPVLAGVLCGWALAWVSRSLLAGFLFGVSPNDPVTYISVGLLFVITATAACLLPAWRAARIDPMEALRYE
jgi:predicted permease